jgi:dihydroorotase
MLGLVDKGILPLGRMVDALTRGPARIVGLAVPRIREGSEANLTLVDPARSWTVAPERLRTKSRNTPFLGQTVQGMVMMTLVAGAIAFEAEK